MVLVYLKNLIFPSRSSSSSSSLQNNPQKSRHSNDIEGGLRNWNFHSHDIDRPSSGSPYEKLNTDSEASHLSFDSDRNFASSSISDDTFVERPRRGFLVDPRVISDATIGLSDGLTVPFALTAGLSALGDTRIVIFGGLAELTAGAISMGMGGYLAARSEDDAYDTALTSTQQLVKSSSASAANIVRSTLAPYFPSNSSFHAPLETVVEHLSCHPDQLVDFIMRFHHSLASPSDTRSAWTSAITIAASYFLGGFLPLLPYFMASTVGAAFLWSVGMMIVALFVFGAGKTWLTNISACDDYAGIQSGDDTEWRIGREYVAASDGLARQHIMGKCVRGGVQMVVLGGLAASASVGLVKVFS